MSLYPSLQKSRKSGQHSADIKKAEFENLLTDTGSLGNIKSIELNKS